MARVVLAKPGLDGHESGVMLVARALRDAGYEVIYLGARQHPDAIAAVVAQEDADVLGLSILTGGHLVHARRVLAALASEGVDDVPVVMGGIVPAAAVAELGTLGVQAVFGPGDSLQTIICCIDGLVANRRRDAPAV